MRPKAKSDRLTPQRIAAFAVAPGKQQSYFWDTEAPRLAVRATSGSKSFVFEGKLSRQTIRITIGDVRNWDIEEARTEARRYQTMLDKGLDPRELAREEAEAKAAAKRNAKASAENEKKLAEFRANYTLRKLCEAYSSHLANIGKTKSSRQSASVFKCHVFEPHPDLADTVANNVTAIQVAMMVRCVAEKGKERTAGTLRSFLSAAFNCACKSPTDSKLPASFIEFNVLRNPVETVATIPGNTSDRYLTPDELKAYINAFGESIQDKALELALYAGGQRMAQILRAKVTDYEQDWKALRLLDGKGRRSKPREHLVPFGPKGQKIVTSLIKRANAQGSPYLFSVDGSKLPMSEYTPGKRLVEIRKGIDCEPFDLRDIRRTVETMMAGMRITTDLRAQVLSHGISGVQATNYDRYKYIEEKRETLVAWERRLEEVVSGKKPAKVVQMNRQSKSATS